MRLTRAKNYHLKAEAPSKSSILGHSEKRSSNRRLNETYCLLPPAFYLLALALLLTACTGQSKPSKANIDGSASADKTSKENLGIQQVEHKLVKVPSTQNSAKQGIVLPEVKPLELEGTLTISGSQVVLPISQAIAQRFIQDGYPNKIALSGIDTEVGFKQFCEEKKVDIVNAVRPINTQESAACAKSGVEPIGFPIATDAVTIVVSSQNNFVPNNLTRDELVKVFTAEKWSDVNPKWPNELIKRIVPSGAGTGGSVDLFAQAILKGNVSQLTNAPNTVFYDFAEQLHSEALINPYMVGFLEYGSYQQNRDKLRAIAIDTVDPFLPGYPITRPLYIYADAKAIRKRSEVEGFVNYYLTYVSEEVPSLGYFAVNPTVLDESKTKFLQLKGNKELLKEASQKK
ncbi:MAG TPA: phosphate ABC transporter substrate-binding protein [Cyanobacteria bacterium UBA11369]|nr:phosphate ABC transporter substrate-binding protein [Cyanobacteria bacterium UBA11371]HBE21365.1 phosphate ABC transporter substrate-binding protein [Cyanobacteria bacterium UBA11367]HBE35377.1 phosphate ABC transporter substrate-binding protein [Cyanobacteria bacterium UBA11368]HBE53346.1 phosphate ABC transporter substrate-binding protein [Cyanobacteria bacterium UBA11369]